MPDPTITAAACIALENAINAGLKLDNNSRSLLQNYAGTVVRVSCLSPDATIYLRVGEHCDVMQYYADSAHDNTSNGADASIEGRLVDWLELLTASDKPSSLINGKLHITGNSKLLIELGQIASELDLDWEGHLANFIGDVPAHLTGRAVKTATEFGGRLNQTLRRALDDFIHEEAQLLPTRIEVDNFYQSLRELEMQVERLQAKVRQYAKSTSTQQPPTESE
jgi:ubiquinone biosynthesis protein UbiJ